MNDPAAKPLPESPGHSGHELTDVHPSHVGLFALGLALMIALVLAFLSWTLWQFEKAAERRDPAQSPLAGPQIAPEPRLQAWPADDMAHWRDEEHHKLSHYGWVDAKRKIVRIPIDRAIELLVERGFPEPDGPVEIIPAKEREP